MKHIKIPGFGEFDIEYLILDLNGTLAIDGIISESTYKKLEKLKEDFSIFIVSGDIHGNLNKHSESLGVNHISVKSEVSPGQQKLNFAISLGENNSICIGNGNSDVNMIKHAAIGIAVINPEGASLKALSVADIIVLNIDNALECIINTQRIIATLQC